MQKKLIALAVAGLVSGGAFAQSNVTVFGTFDAGVRNTTNVDAAGNSLLKMNDPGNYNSNRFGLRGTEDMGGGLKARFWLEGAFGSGTGAQPAGVALWGRSAWVGLEGSMGTLDFGRQYTVIFKTTGAYDPFNYKYTGPIPIAGLDGARRDNDIQWSLTTGGLTFRAQRALGEVAGNNTAGATTEAGLSYANGPMNVGAAYGSQKNAAGNATTTNWTLGGAYVTGPLRLVAGYDKKDVGAAVGASTATKWFWFGGSYDLKNAWELSAAAYDGKIDAPTAAASGTNRLYIFGATYAFSKRTNFYADYDRRNLGGVARIGTKTSQNGVSAGINHIF